MFLPGESDGWRGLVGCGLWGCKESDTTKQLTHTYTHTHTHTQCSRSELMHTHTHTHTHNVPEVSLCKQTLRMQK